ncbi:MAG: PDZ domain-containing protein [Planctomycetota bacterium]
MDSKPLSRWRIRVAVALTAGAWAVALLGTAAIASAADLPFVLDLPGGGRLPGAFAPAPSGSEPRETLPWRAPQFAAPLEFRLDGIVGIRSTATAAAAAADPDIFSCRLRGGDSIDGRLQEIDAKGIVIAPPDGDPLTISRDVATGLGRRTAAAATGYIGPGGLAGWAQEPESSWRDEAGRIVSDRPNAAVTRDVAAPARARYDIVLSWRKQPEFVLAVAAADGKNVDPFRLEMLSASGKDPVLVLVRHEQAAGMLEPVPVPQEERGRLRLTLFVDQSTGRLAAVVGGGERPIDITVAPTAGRAASPRFRLQLRAGDICLERIRVSEWKADEPRLGNADTTQIGLRDGSEIEGEIVSLDGEGKLVVRSADGEQTRRLDELESIAFAAAEDEAERPAGGAATGPQVRLMRRGGGVLTGQIMGVADDGVVIARPGLDRTVTVSFADLHSLVSLETTEPGPLPGRIGTLKLDDAELAGCLVDGVAWGGGLAWQPQGSVLASPLAPNEGGVTAVVEYVAPPAIVEEAGGAVEIGGIGATVNQDEEGFFVVAMLSEEGAAARDGRIEPGDRILAVQPIKDGPFMPTKGLELTTVMNLMRGRVGSTVGLRLQQPGAEGEPRGINLVRGLIYVAERGMLDQALAEHARVVAGQAGGGDQTGRFPSLLVLRSGDVVPVALERIDAEGVRLRSPVTAGAGEEVVTVANGLVRAIELDPAAGRAQITPDRFQRLTTLPRSQRDDPPTHLLRLRTQDYLRGRLESLDEDEVVFSVLDQKKRLPRAAVSRIIWLHPDEIDFAASGAAAPEREPEPDAGGEGGAKPQAESAAGGVLVQGVSPRGRATLVAERMEGTAIIGTSPAFGASRIDTTRIDRLLIGRAVGSGDEPLPFDQWRLRLAPLPRALRDEE